MIYMPYGELEVPEARYSSFLKGTLRSSLLMSRISETLSNVTYVVGNYFWYGKFE